MNADCSVQCPVAPGCQQSVCSQINNSNFLRQHKQRSTVGVRYHDNSDLSIWDNRQVLLSYNAAPHRSHCVTLRPSVRPSVPCLHAVNSKMENRTTFKLRGEVTHVRSNGQSNFEVIRSKVSVTGGGNVKIVFGAISSQKVSIHVEPRPGWPRFV